MLKSNAKKAHGSIAYTPWAAFSGCNEFLIIMTFNHTQTHRYQIVFGAYKTLVMLNTYNRFAIWIRFRGHENCKWEKVYISRYFRRISWVHIELSWSNFVMHQNGNCWEFKWHVTAICNFEWIYSIIVRYCENSHNLTTFNKNIYFAININSSNRHKIILLW